MRSSGYAGAGRQQKMNGVGGVRSYLHQVSTTLQKKEIDLPRRSVGATDSRFQNPGRFTCSTSLIAS